MKTFAVFGALFATAARAEYISTYSDNFGLTQCGYPFGMYFGVVTDVYHSPHVEYDPPYMEQLGNKKDFSMYTPKNSMKWEVTEPSKNDFHYEEADKLVSFAKSVDGRVRCRSLVSLQQLPSWVAQLPTNASVLDAITNHITKVMTHFKDDCYSWDVVSEAVDDSGAYRNSSFFEKTGSSYIAHAFKVADKVRKDLGLKVKLYYDDYDIDWMNGAKTDFTQNMIKDLVKQGVPIDGVGFQAHYFVGEMSSEGTFLDIMDYYYNELKLEVAFTQLDIMTLKHPGEEQEKQQGEDYAFVVRMCMQAKKCVGITFTELSDDYMSFPPHLGYALPWYQEQGKGTQWTRKGCYDNMMVEFGYSGAPYSRNPENTTRSQ